MGNRDLRTGYKKPCRMSIGRYKNFTKSQYGANLNKLPTTKLNKLIDDVLQKRNWTQNRLAQELNIGPETISRWRAGAGIHRGHHEELIRLSEEEIDVVQIKSRGIPFSLTIPSKSLKFSLDKNGNIQLDGIMLVANNRED